MNRVLSLVPDSQAPTTEEASDGETAERAGVQMPDSKLVTAGKPAAGAEAMVATSPAGLDIPLKVLVWEDGNGAVSVSYNSPEFLADRYHIGGSLRAPFGAVESFVDAALGA